MSFLHLQVYCILPSQAIISPDVQWQAWQTSKLWAAKVCVVCKLVVSTIFFMCGLPRPARDGQNVTTLALLAAAAPLLDPPAVPQTSCGPVSCTQSAAPHSAAHRWSAKPAAATAATTGEHLPLLSVYVLLRYCQLSTAWYCKTHDAVCQLSQESRCQC